MSHELYITRAEAWYQSEDDPIASEEWLDYVQSGRDLVIDTAKGRGPYYAIWKRHKIGKGYAWFNWSDGRLETKGADEVTFAKMLKIAKHFGATVQDGDGVGYRTWRELVNAPRRVRSLKQSIQPSPIKSETVGDIKIEYGTNKIKEILLVRHGKTLVHLKYGLLQQELELIVEGVQFHLHSMSPVWVSLDVMSRK